MSITALLALVPLWTGAVSLYRLAFRHSADVRLHVLECSTRSISVAAENAGDRAGILRKADVAVSIPGHATTAAVPAKPTENRDIVRPGETSVLSLQPQINGIPTTLPSPDVAGCEYRIAVTVEDFDGRSLQKDLKCSCPSPSAG